MSNDFWPLHPSSKLDELKVPQHTHHIHAAMIDKNTCITQVSRDTFIVHGLLEGLLFRPVGCMWGIAMRIGAGLCSILSEDVPK